MPDYRRGPLDQRKYWHWCRECSKWPTYDYDVAHTKPKEGEFCPECDEKSPLDEQSDEF